MRSYLLAASLLITTTCASAAGSGGVTARSAKGRTGPVGLTLELYKPKIKVGENLFVKMTLKNFDKEPFLVTEWFYRGSDDLDVSWYDACEGLLEPIIQIEDSRGLRIKPDIYLTHQITVSPFEITVSSVDAATQRRIDAWEAQGIPWEEIQKRLEKGDAEREKQQRDAKYPFIELRRGQSAPSASWCSGRNLNQGAGAVTCPGSGFVELPFFSFKKPGRYRIRAIRDYSPTEDTKEWAKQWSVLVRTGWINFEVLP